MHGLRITPCKHFHAQRLPHAVPENGGLCSSMRTKTLIFFFRNVLTFRIGQFISIVVIIIQIISERHIPWRVTFILLVEISKIHPCLFKAGNTLLPQRRGIHSCCPECLSGIVHQSPCIVIFFTVSISRACKREQGKRERAEKDRHRFRQGLSLQCKAKRCFERQFCFHISPCHFERSPVMFSTTGFLRNFFSGTSVLRSGTVKERTARMSTVHPLKTNGLTPNSLHSVKGCQNP